MPQTIHIHQFDNGLTLLAEPMDWLESTAFVINTPAGSARDPEDVPGLGNFTGEMLQRGSGDRDSRVFTNALENLGVVFDSSISNNSASFRGAMPADRFDTLRTRYLPGEDDADVRSEWLSPDEKDAA